MPTGYYCTEDKSGSKVLYEDTEVYRPVVRSDAPVREAEVRSVAKFPKGTKLREIEEVADLDNRSRNPLTPKTERRQVLWLLAERFQA